MEEPARKCQPTATLFGAPSKPGLYVEPSNGAPTPGSSSTLMGLTIHHSFGRYHIGAQLDRRHTVALGGQRDQGLLPIRYTATGPDPRV